MLRSARRLQLHIETPLLTSEPLSRLLGANVYLKMDCWQPPGSFKIRGIGETVQRAVRGGAKQILSSSGGNAGLAAAYAARALGVPCRVILPSTTPQRVHGLLERYGAEVEVHGDAWDEAHRKAEALAEQLPAALIHPFGAESTWTGHATVVEELSRQLPALGVAEAPDALVTCVGGGGLLMGLMQGLENQGWQKTRLLACETRGAASMARSLESDELVTLPAIESVATSLGARTVGRDIFEKCRQWGPERLRTFVMSDAEAISACVRFAEDHRVLVEPACGAALSAVTQRAPALEGCRTVVVQVCGGALINLQMMAQLASDHKVL